MVEKDWYALKNPEGFILNWSIGIDPEKVKKKVIRWFENWQHAEEEGYSIVQVEVREIGPCPQK